MDLSPRRRGLAPLKTSPKKRASPFEVPVSAVVNEGALRTSASTYRHPLHAALDALPHLVWMTNGRSDVEYGNQAWLEFTGAAQEDDPPQDWIHWLHAHDQSSARQLWQQALHLGGKFQGEYRLRHHSGDYRWFLIVAQFQHSEHEDAGHWFVTCTDIHDRVLAQQELSESLGTQKSMLDVSVDCIKILRTDGTLSHLNKSGCMALGVSPESGFGQRWLDLLPPEVRIQGQRALNTALKGKNARFDGKSAMPGAAPQYWDNILTPVNGPDGKPTSILCVSRDITLQREAENRLRIASEMDELTNLPNRRSFNAQLKRSLAIANTCGQALGVMLLDLDHFKHVNDTLGHPAGDHLLRVLSRRLQVCLEGVGWIARLGGDEFAIIVSNITHERELMQIAQRVLAQIDAPITYTGKLINGGMSIGCAMYPRDAHAASSLMKCADTALNDLKAGGRGGARMFSMQMTLAAEAAAAQLECARRIVRTDAVIPHYQPKIRLADRKVVGFEALLRWHHPTQGLQMPRTVEAAFKDYELSSRIGEMMRNKVFRDLADWMQAGLPVLPVSINAAPVEFLRDDYAERMLEQLQVFGIPGALVELEITEHMLGERGAEYVVRSLKSLKQAGVSIALDDFGTGHSSLVHLRDYPMDCLKIDCNFVRRIGEDPTILAIVQAIGQLAPNLGLAMVAEGIETEAQCKALQKAGYQVGQGFLFSRAVSAQAVAHTLAHALNAPYAAEEQPH